MAAAAILEIEVRAIKNGHLPPDFMKVGTQAC
jgi:hypothetical protein